MEIKLTLKDMRRFWSKVKFTRKGCWEWQGHFTSDKGNGRRMPDFFLGNQKVGARRVSHAIHFGQPEGQVGCSCGNERCVSPQHLLPLPEANKALKGYVTRSEAVRLTAGLARRVINLRNAGRSQPSIAAATGLAQQTVCNVIRMGRYCRERQLEPKAARSAK